MIIFLLIMLGIIGFWASREIHADYLNQRMAKMMATWDKEDADNSSKS